MSSGTFDPTTRKAAIVELLDTAQKAYLARQNRIEDTQIASDYLGNLITARQAYEGFTQLGYSVDDIARYARIIYKGE